MQSHIRWCATVIVIAMAACGPHGDGESGEADQVSALVQDVSDATTQPKRFEELFAKGKEPDKGRRKEYAQYNFRPIEQPSLDGDTAKVRVLVRDRMDQTVGEVEWSAAREGDQWRLSNAPLPKG